MAERKNKVLLTANLKIALIKCGQELKDAYLDVTNSILFDASSSPAKTSASLLTYIELFSYNHGCQCSDILTTKKYII
jgi:hypothetical protein